MQIPATLVRKTVIKKSWYDKNDPQSHKVYRMEREFIGWGVLTQHSQEYLESVTKHACRQWKVAVAPVRVSSRPSYHVYGTCDSDGVWLNSYKDKPGNNLGTLIHELAHWITDHKYGEDNAPHGPEFVYVYGTLLSQYKLFPFDCFKHLCEKHDVEILDVCDNP